MNQKQEFIEEKTFYKFFKILSYFLTLNIYFIVFNFLYFAVCFTTAYTKDSFLVYFVSFLPTGISLVAILSFIDENDGFEMVSFKKFFLRIKQNIILGLKAGVIFSLINSLIVIDFKFMRMTKTYYLFLLFLLFYMLGLFCLYKKIDHEIRFKQKIKLSRCIKKVLSNSRLSLLGGGSLAILFFSLIKFPRTGFFIFPSLLAYLTNYFNEKIKDDQI